MEERNGRRVHISFSGHETKISLAWFEPSTETKRGFRVVDLHYVKGMVSESVGKALDILVPHWSKVFASDYSNAVVSCELDNDPDIFDQITEAEEPEQFFISRHVLEYCGGKSASLRAWDIEFNKKYAGLIEFNKQAEAQS